jgi:hypothetical protein
MAIPKTKYYQQKIGKSNQPQVVTQLCLFHILHQLELLEKRKEPQHTCDMLWPLPLSLLLATAASPLPPSFSNAHASTTTTRASSSTDVFIGDDVPSEGNVRGGKESCGECRVKFHPPIYSIGVESVVRLARIEFRCACVASMSILVESRTFQSVRGWVKILCVSKGRGRKPPS